MRAKRGMNSRTILIYQIHLKFEEGDVILVSSPVPIGLGLGFGAALGLGFGLGELDLGLGPWT